MEETIIPVTTILMPLVLVPTIITLKHRQKKREWEHLERMRELELHLPRSSRGESLGPRSVVAIGAGVPTASVLGAFLTCVGGPPSVEGVPLAAIAWGSAALISLGAMLTSLILALLVARSRDRVEAGSLLDQAKPVYDPDALDVVGSRG
ncbi:MAG TPA: hypothetical protein VFF52_18215 [Isosphaeraceae bacterium]|nr:hypothetical protein [Isosphaeraceae bacterium]